MRKGLIVLLVAAVAVAFALPAMADLTPKNLNVSGFYRSKAWLSNFHDGSGGPSLRTGEGTDAEQTNAYVEQRARVKFEFGTENVKAVWFLESDMLWGDSSAVVARNQGGALGADSIQIETKNLYLWFKVPDTSLDFTVGLQNQSDDYAGVLYGGADLAGVFMTGQFEPVKYKLGFAKLYENTNAADGRRDPVHRLREVHPGEGGRPRTELRLPAGRHREEQRRRHEDQSVRQSRCESRSSGSGQLQAAAVHPRRQRDLQGRPGDHFGVRLLPVREI